MQGVAVADGGARPGQDPIDGRAAFTRPRRDRRCLVEIDAGGSVAAADAVVLD
jgi:hypothetical protein